jgi:metallo-beta-lactamase class B
VLLNSHPHFDHAGGLRALQEASGAELWVSEGDADIMAAGGAGDRSFGPLRFIGLGRFDAPRVDHRFQDGATIRVGPIELTAHVTPGHTPGCTSWAFPVRHNERDLLAVNICSLTLLPFMSFKDAVFVSSFEQSFATLRALDADIFLASHGGFFNLSGKRRVRGASADSSAPFIDREGYRAFIDRAEARFREKAPPTRAVP